MTGTRRSAGFTLLEVLVALVVLGFILSGLIGGTRLGLLAVGAQSRTVAEHADLEPVDRLLRRLVRHMALPNNERQPGLVGDADRFACITQMPSPDGAGSAPRVDALLFAAAGQLVLRWSPHLHAERLGPRPAPAEEILLEGVNRLEISYLSPDHSSWQTSWDRTDLPALVRIRLLFAPGDPRRWPPLVAATEESRARGSLGG